MDSQSKLLSELLSDQAAFITSPKTSLANYWGALPPCPPPVSTGLPFDKGTELKLLLFLNNPKQDYSTMLYHIQSQSCFCYELTVIFSNSRHNGKED